MGIVLICKMIDVDVIPTHFSAGFNMDMCLAAFKLNRFFANKILLKNSCNGFHYLCKN